MARSSEPACKPFQGVDGDWYWKNVARNGRMIAAAGEGVSEQAGRTRPGPGAALSTPSSTGEAVAVPDPPGADEDAVVGIRGY